MTGVIETSALRRVLVANRGEIAVRIVRACRDEGVEVVVAVSEADEDSLAARLADGIVNIGAPSPTQSYLRVGQIVCAALLARCDAVHPGYGFLSEQPALAESCVANGLVFVGPGADVIRRGGDKVAARAVARRGGVPIGAGSDTVDTVDAAIEVGADIGFPVLLKAAAGGGGRGMVQIDDPAELATRFAMASSEALSAFGDGRLYVERLVENARHVEVQLLADSHGNIVHLGDRDCSVQRRYQKVLEEAPAPALSAELHHRLGEAALALGRELGYIGAGTVEFLVDRDRDVFSFLEVNTRVQVEHPVTEMVTGIDIVREQLRIAAGSPLSFTQDDVIVSGHSIECRINAESVAAGFVPSPGRVVRWSPPDGPGIRLDSHVFAGYDVPPHYDSLLAKLIVGGTDRDDAIRHLRAALAVFEVEGVDTTIELHQRIVDHPDFQANNVNTKWLERMLLRQLEGVQLIVAEIEIIDQTLRDGQQSLWGMRMKVADLAEVAEDIDQAGYRVVDLTGSSIFECMMRYNREDPWDGLDLWRSWMPTSRLRSGSRSNCIAKFGLTPDSLMDLWIRTLAKHGIDSFWIYDCLYNMDKMERLCRVVADSGCEAVPAIMYGISPVHTDEWFAARVREFVSWGITDAIYFEDAAGILKPERARTLMPALVEAAGDVPIEMQCHNTVGLAGYNYLIGVESGIRILHTAAGPLANGPSVPSTEQTIENLRWESHTTSVDLERVQRVSEHLRRVAVQEGHPIGVPNEYNVFPYHHQLPGGMTGTLKAQLVQYDMSDRFAEVLEEIVRVREDLGHPISATPFSQLMGIQAVLNVITGERYGTVPDEVLVYVLGHLGKPPAPINPDILDRMLSTSRGKEIQKWSPPQPTIEELKEQHGDRSMTDEELLRRYLVPLPDVEATHVAGPAAREFHFEADAVPTSVVLDLLRSSRATFAQVEMGSTTVTLRR